jgi:hypothetical protein
MPQPLSREASMIARAHGDHIHSRRPDGGPDRCHRRQSCTVLPALLDVLDAEPFSAGYVRQVAAQMRDDHGRRDWAELERQQRAWLDAEIERVLGSEAFRRLSGLEAQGLYLSWGESTIPLPPDED